MSRIKRLTKEAGWVVFGQVAAVAGALVLVRVLTEYLNPAQYGELALGLTVAGFVNQVAMGGVTAGIGRFYSIAAEKQNFGGYLHATRNLLAYATAAVVAIGLVIMASLYWLGYSHWIGLASAALALSILSGYNSTLSGIQNAARQRAIVAFHGGLEAWLKILLTVSIVLWFGTSSTGVIIGYACSSLLITGSQLIFLRRTISHRQSRASNCQNWMSEIWAYSLPFTTWGAFTWIQQSSDRWVLQIYTSTADVGKYAVVYQLGYSTTVMATGVIIAFFAPILYQRAGNADNFIQVQYVINAAKKIVMTFIIMTFACFAIALNIHSYIFRIFAGPLYQQSSHHLPWLVLSAGLYGSGTALAMVLQALKLSKERIPKKIGTSLIGISFMFIGAKYYGVNGVVLASVGFSCIYLLWTILLAKKYTELKLHTLLDMTKIEE